MNKQDEASNKRKHTNENLVEEFPAKPIPHNRLVKKACRVQNHYIYLNEALDSSDDDNQLKTPHQLSKAGIILQSIRLMNEKVDKLQQTIEIQNKKINLLESRIVEVDDIISEMARKELELATYDNSSPYEEFKIGDLINHPCFRGKNLLGRVIQVQEDEVVYFTLLTSIYTKHIKKGDHFIVNDQGCKYCHRQL